MRYVWLALGALLSAAPASAQVRMISVDATTEQVRIRNFATSGGDVDVSSWFMCRGVGTYVTLASLPLVAGDLSLGPGESVTVAYTGQVPSSGDGIGLYSLGQFLNPDALDDWMQYLTTNGARLDVAAAAGIWSAGETVTGVGPYVYTGDGSQNGAAFWISAPPPVVVPTLTPGTWLLLTLILLASGAVLRRAGKVLAETPMGSAPLDTRDPVAQDSRRYTSRWTTPSR